MHAELSHYFLFMILWTIFFFLSIQPFFLAFGYTHYRQKKLNSWINSFAFLVITASFFSMIWSYACSDFSFYHILNHGNLRSPLFYKISSTWSNHEGSLLLWCWLLSLAVFLFCIVTKASSNRQGKDRCRSGKRSKFELLKKSMFSQNHFTKSDTRANEVAKERQDADFGPLDSEREEYVFGYSIVLLLFILLFFVGFLTYTSNPFLKNLFLSMSSILELNPVLQDPILAIHPPCIYAGYVFSALGFSLCLSKLNWQKKKPTSRPKHWHKSEGAKDALGFLKPEGPPRLLWGFSPEGNFSGKLWILASWFFLTIGIMLGSWWAYHELGWGGWWFWDPVENASLMPWLLVTASLHAISTPRQSGTLGSVNILSTFLLSILGTFLVRSGLLASVHSFAIDPARSVPLLLFLLLMGLISVRAFVLLDRFRPKKIESVSESRKREWAMSPFFLLPILKKTSLFCRAKEEELLFIQNIFFSLICIVVFCGTCAPIIFQFFFHRDLSTGACFYNTTLVPLFTSIFIGLVTMHYGLWSKAPKGEKKATSTYSYTLKQQERAEMHKDLSHKKETGFSFSFLFSRANKAGQILFIQIPQQQKVLKCLYFILFIWIIISFCINLLNASYLDTLYIILSILCLCSFLLVTQRKNLKNHEQAKVLNFQPSKLIKLSDLLIIKRTISVILGHISLVFFLLGIILSNSMKVYFTNLLNFGDKVSLGSHTCSLRGIDHHYSLNYHSICGNLIIYKNNISGQAGLRPSGLGDFGSFTTAQARNLLLFFFSSNKNSTSKWSGELEAKTQIPHSCFFAETNDRFPVIAGTSETKASSLKQEWRFNAKTDNRLDYKLLERSMHDSFCLFPEKRFFYSNEQLNITKVAIHTNLFTDFYALIGAQSNTPTLWFTTLMKLPFIFGIWLGFGIAALSGVFALKKECLKYQLKWS